MKQSRAWFERVALGLFLTFAICGGFLVVGTSRAQFSGGGSVDLTPYALKTTVPAPLGAVPPGPNGLGAAGSSGTYVPGNAAQRQAVMRTTLNTLADGTWSVTWAGGFSFISSTPTVVVEAGNPAGANAIICNWRTRSATGAAGFCQQTNTALISLLGITITVAPTTPATNTPISVIMAEPTQ